MPGAELVVVLLVAEGDEREASVLLVEMFWLTVVEVVHPSSL